LNTNSQKLKVKQYNVALHDNNSSQSNEASLAISEDTSVVHSVLLDNHYREDYNHLTQPTYILPDLPISVVLSTQEVML